MSPEALLAVVALAWLGLLVGLWRVAASVERLDRLVRRWEADRTSGQGSSRG